MIDQAQKLRELAKSENARSSVTIKRTPAANAAQSIAITSGKGGVGKTTLSIVLAHCLAMMQKKILLLDADLGLANIHILLGVAPRYNISHAVAGECALKDIVMEVSQNIYVAPGASGLENLANMDIGRLERLRSSFMELESGYDYLLMDTGAGIGSAVTGFARHADLVLLVMTPDPSSLADAYAMVKILYDKGNTNIAVVVNMVSSEREGQEAFFRLNKLVVQFLKTPVTLYAILPNDGNVLRLGRKQMHLSANDTNGKFYSLTTLLAKKICGDSATRRGSFFSKIFGGA